MTPRAGRIAVTLALLAVCFVCLVTSAKAGDPEGCEPYPITEHSPTGVVGCVVYGVGTASMWGGPGVARNDCVWPWTDCQTITVRSLETGIVIIVTPRMFGDLYTTTVHERIVDLDPAAVAALGLDPARGLWPVEVLPFREGESSAVLPDTAVEVRP